MKKTLSNISSLRAAEYSDNQINDFWVDTQQHFFKEQLSLKSSSSRYLQGSKGTGKTHLLRYFSLKLAIKRHNNIKDAINELGAISIYLRLPNDASKFNIVNENSISFFNSYLELLILKSFFDLVKEILIFENNELTLFFSLCNQVLKTENLNDIESIIFYINNKIDDIDIALNDYILFDNSESIKKTQLINNSIFKLKNLLSAINPFFKDLNFVFLLDEFENIESSYKKVINNFVRMAEPGYSFRVAGRKESNNFNETYNEQNLSGHEFILVDLDEIYRTEHSRKIHETEIRKFISDFIKKNLSFINEHAVIDVEKLFGKEDDYKEYINNSFLVQEKNIKLYKNIKEEFIKSIDIEKSNASLIFNILNQNITSLILIKLNILRFGKTKKLNDKNLIETARNINNDAINYQNGSIKKSSYSNALNHYKSDILCQLFHMENPQNLPIYYGFDTLCKITSYNPRNVLNILYKIEEQLLFENKDFFSNNFIDIKTQSRAYRESSRYYFNEDTSYGSISMQAKQATKRIGDYLQAARFSLKIPESSPLAISFSENYLNKTTWKIYNACIEFSLLQVMGSRNDRNKHHRNIKLRLNPMLSPIWNLPTSYRGDLSINKDLTEMIFDPSKHDDFYKELNKVKARWNKISFTASKTDILEPLQGDLFR